MLARHIVPGCVLALLISFRAALALGGCPVPAYTFGSSGGAPGQFSYPFCLAFGPEGDLYVTDQHNERVQVFNTDGAYLRGWSIPPGPNGYAYPTGICVSNGVVWVASNQGQNVSRWSTEGAFIGYAPKPPGGWRYPVDIAADLEGNVYVCNSGAGTVVKIDGDGAHVLATFNVGGSPYGIDVDATNTISVGNYATSSVSRWTTGGQFLGSWGTGTFYGAEGITHDSVGNLYVCDTGHRRVMKYDNRGTCLCDFGTEGQALGQLGVPCDIAVGPDGDLFVVEYTNHRVQRFTTGALTTRRSTWGSIKDRFR